MDDVGSDEFEEDDGSILGLYVGIDVGWFVGT